MLEPDHSFAQIAKADESIRYTEQLERYLQVCNAVLDANKDRFPYSRIFEASEAALEGRAVELALVDEEPKARCVVTLSHSHIERASDGADPAPVSRISAATVADVLANPEKYIADPSLIDWGWLMRRS